jgi:hypothetical protein
MHAPGNVSQMIILLHRFGFPYSISSRVRAADSLTLPFQSLVSWSGRALPRLSF